MSGTSDTICILHVDDDPSLSDMVATFLEREDDRIRVQTATDAEEGRKMLAEHDIDCIVSDYDMPGQNGIEFLETVRQEYPDLPFILYTGKGSEEVASEAISKGVTDYLQKDTGTSQYTVLLNRIENAVSQFRTRQELELQQAESARLLDWLDHALTATDTYVWQWDLKTDEIQRHPTTEPVFGIKSDAIGGVHEGWVDHVHPDDRPAVKKTITEGIESGEGYQIICRVETEDGSWRWVRDRAEVEIEDGELIRAVGSVTDVTDQIEREQELAETVRENERFKKLIDHTSDLIFVVNEMGAISYINPVVEGLLGYTPEELEGTSGFDLIHSDDLARAQDEFAKVIEDPAYIGSVELRVKHNDGTNIDFEVRARNLLDDPDIGGVIVIGREVTERKERERELQHKNEQLDEFASVLSHDLRNPLNVAEGNLRLAIEECDSDRLNDVEEALTRIEALIGDMLSLAQSGKTIGETEAVKLSTLVEACWRNVETASATLVTETETTIQADKSRLKQLLENLIRNAVEHDGTEFTLTVGDLPRGFFIEDDGSGIPKDERDDVLKPGYSTSKEGTGFGLSIAREIAEAHGWEIEITSGTDGGARFEFRDVQRV